MPWPLTPPYLLSYLWLAWGISWVIAAAWSSRPLRVEAGAPVWAYRGLLTAGAVLLSLPLIGYDPRRLWPLTPAQIWLLDVAALAGFAFCWWARLHLGRLWSSAVTIKPEHRIVDSGPYGLVRHPIYTGLLLAIAASVAMNATAPGIAGGLLMLTGFLVKLRLEEAALRQAFGAAAYGAYARTVPMLVPFTAWARR